ncbi:uncharacterized protein LOC109598853 [Aethina tumida]|uniref:uncharacterized protein LOC109598853 n=1 Tax=Aethina tumida TaxID=116153 RepID=UPI00096B4D25|nr:uncharacterized protein LOC109598853 [Aethina tumida]
MNLYTSLIVTIISVTTALPPNSQHRFLTSIGDRQYYIENYLKANWELAFLTCRKRGLHLVSLEEKTYLKQLKDYLSKNDLRDKSFWTSATNKNLDSWYWFGVGEPFKDDIEGDSNNEGGHCLTMKGDFFHSTNCNSTNYFICEYIPNPSSRY